MHGGRAAQRARNPSTSGRLSTPTGWPSSSTMTRARLAHGLDGVGDRLAGADRSGAASSMCAPTRSASRARPAEQRVHQRALADRAGDLGRHHRRLGAYDRHLRDGVLAQDRAPPRRSVSAGWVWTRSGRLPSPPSCLPRSTSPTVCGWRGSPKPYCPSQASSKTLPQVAAAAVGQQHDDHRLGSRRPARARRRAAPPRRRPCRTSRRPAGPPRGPAAGSSANASPSETAMTAVADVAVVRARARSPRPRPRPGRGDRCRRSRPSRPGRRRRPAPARR